MHCQGSVLVTYMPCVVVGALVVVILFFAFLVSAQNSPSKDHEDGNNGSSHQDFTHPPPPPDKWFIKTSLTFKRKKKNTKGIKTCPSCRYRLSITNPHSYCLCCLSRRHDMTACKLCLSLNRKTFRVKCIRYYLWSILPPLEGLPDKAPSSPVWAKMNIHAICDIDREDKF